MSLYYGLRVTGLPECTAKTINLIFGLNKIIYHNKEIKYLQIFFRMRKRSYKLPSAKNIMIQLCQFFHFTLFFVHAFIGEL